MVAEPVLAQELQQLNATLLEIKALLAEQVEVQGVDLLLKRSQFTAGQVSQLEERLRAAEASRDRAQEERKNMELQLERMASRAERSGERMSPEDLEEITLHITTRMDQLNKRFRSQEAEIAELQNKLADKQRELRDWQDLTDRRLSGL
jgi:chromosome segregation ATPase